jgi:hypothetical protein
MENDLSKLGHGESVSYDTAREMIEDLRTQLTSKEKELEDFKNAYIERNDKCNELQKELLEANNRCKETSIAFAEWLKTTSNEDLSPWDCFVDDLKTVPELYALFLSQCTQSLTNKTKEG